MSPIFLAVLLQAAPLTCRGESRAGAVAKTMRESVQRSPLYAFAEKTFGAPTSCELRSQKSEDGMELRLTFVFKGAKLVSHQGDAEMSELDLLVPNGFADEKAAIDALKKQLDGDSVHPDWSKLEESKRDDGSVVRLARDPAGDVNISGVLGYQHGKLVQLGEHAAL